ncbi:MAG: hypothetical protein HZA49_00475 [Planctomycetes bacterium]|nr:hypothetical protein [Planctomycetota bacterium]
MNDKLLYALIILGVAAGFAIPAFLGAWLWDKYKKSCVFALNSILVGYHLPEKGNIGEIHRVTFHTYYGILLLWVQTEHIIPFDPANVEPTAELLWALLKFNLKRGTSIRLGVIMPILSYLEYRSAIKTLRIHQLTDKQ